LVVCFSKLYTNQSFTTVLPYLQIPVQDSIPAIHDAEDVDAVAQARQAAGLDLRRQSDPFV